MPFDANDPDTKAALKAAIDEALETANSEHDEKSKRLLDDLKKAKAAARAASDIKPEDMAALESTNEKLTADLAVANKTAKDATTAAEKATKALADESGFTHKLVAENGLLKALSDNGVTDPAYLEAAKALHLPAVKVSADGTERKAMYGDKPLDEAIKEWAAGDVGKKFVAAPVNGGGGAPGGKKGTEAGKTMARAAFDAMDSTAQMTFSKEGGTVVDATA